MTVCVTSLASGSSGNALLIQSGRAALLVDCGLPQRTIERYLRHAGDGGQPFSRLRGPTRQRVNGMAQRRGPSR